MKKNDEIRTRFLSEAEVRSVVEGLPSFIKDLVGDCIVSVDYGWGCNIHPNLQYQSMDVGISWLDRILADSIDQQIFCPARSDMTVATPDDGFSIQFCHESDIHLSGGKKELLQRACEHELLKEFMEADG